MAPQAATRPARLAARATKSVTVLGGTATLCHVAGDLADLLAVADLTDRLLSALDQPGSDGLASDRFRTDLRALDARVVAKLGDAVAPSQLPPRLRLVDSLAE